MPPLPFDGLLEQRAHEAVDAAASRARKVKAQEKEALEKTLAIRSEDSSADASLPPLQRWEIPRACSSHGAGSASAQPHNLVPTDKLAMLQHRFPAVDKRTLETALEHGEGHAGRAAQYVMRVSSERQRCGPFAKIAVQSPPIQSPRPPATMPSPRPAIPAAPKTWAVDTEVSWGRGGRVPSVRADASKMETAGSTSSWPTAYGTSPHGVRHGIDLFGGAN